MSPPDRQYRWAAGQDAFVLSVVAAVVYFPLAAYGPSWWQGSRLPDMDPPFDLGWLHDSFAWTAVYVGRPLLGVFLAMIVLLPIVAAFTNGFRTGPPVVAGVVTAAYGVPAIALAAVPAVAVGWFLLTQIAALIAPWLGMYHGDSVPAVP
ncbi:hypothetical protein Q0Z83_025560 [Actinoplanes sichuanensis]|uniref:Uncharacterized protein n=1 Tax=Actinoplanes sichuanensis TaxID=512349 RepID=A0ABW4AAL7_9ACTN|nr:hypothetical protein [Actinoplanes sichuanensis]BEL04365.1 hypothetical protein Q0Z83_025560 [Actinoplanes sichuanensis]